MLYPLKALNAGKKTLLENNELIQTFLHKIVFRPALIIMARNGGKEKETNSIQGRVNCLKWKMICFKDYHLLKKLLNKQIWFMEILFVCFMSCCFVSQSFQIYLETRQGMHTFGHIIVRTPLRAFLRNRLSLMSPAIDFATSIM